VPHEYRTAYLDLVSKLCTFLMPLSVTLMFCAVPLVQVLLGERWHQAGMILTGLAPALAAMGVSYAVGDIFVTQNRSQELRNLGLVEMVIRVGSVVIASQWGLLTTAYAFSAATIVVTVLRVVVSGRSGPVTARDQIKAWSPSLFPAAGAAIFCAAILFALQGYPAIVRTLSFGLGGMIGATLGALSHWSSRRALRELFEVFLGKKLTAMATRVFSVLKR